MTVMARRALLVIDVQGEYFAGGALPVTHPAGSAGRILEAMDAASAAGVPVLVVQHVTDNADARAFRRGTPGWELHPEVAGRPRAALIEKALPGAFTGTGLEDRIRAEGADTLVISGYMTQMCCDTTARQAVHRGLAVEFLSDATGTLDFENAAGRVSAEQLHRAALVTLQSRFARVMTTREWSDTL